ncbi:MAG: hypothetical protein HQM11_01655 [SAR324 cluster bacterium]|nr:hypothetical protein [SAR324 cluster bacterium]
MKKYSSGRESLPKIELVLEGGAYQVAFSVGALMFIREYLGNLPAREFVSRIRASSAGIPVGLFFLFDHMDQTHTIFDILTDPHVLKLKRNRPHKGYLNTKAIVKMMHKILCHDLDTLKTGTPEFYYPVVNTQTGDTHIISNQEHERTETYMFQSAKFPWKSMQAAMSPPILSNPVKLKLEADKERFADGQFGSPFALSAEALDLRLKRGHEPEESVRKIYLLTESLDRMPSKTYPLFANIDKKIAKTMQWIPKEWRGIDEAGLFPPGYHRLFEEYNQLYFRNMALIRHEVQAEKAIVIAPLKSTKLRSLTRKPQHLYRMLSLGYFLARNHAPLLLYLNEIKQAYHSGIFVSLPFESQQKAS